MSSMDCSFNEQHNKNQTMCFSLVHTTSYRKAPSSSNNIADLSLILALSNTQSFTHGSIEMRILNKINEKRHESSHTWSNLFFANNMQTDAIRISDKVVDIITIKYILYLSFKTIYTILVHCRSI